MPATVPETFSSPVRAGIASGLPVRGVQWTQAGRALNWLLGRGRVILPATRVEGSGVAPSSTATYRAQLWTREQARHRCWHVALRLASGGGVALATITFPDGATATATLYDSEADRRIAFAGFHTVEEIASPTNGPVAVEITLANDATSTDDVYIDSISCFELPRREIGADGTDFGVDLGTVTADSPIYDDAGKSVGGVARGIARAQAYDPRCLFTYMRASGDGISTSSGAFVALFDEGPAVQPSQQFIGETLRPCTVYVYALCDVGTAGEVRVTATSGDSVTLTVTSTSGAWVSGTLDVYAEDLSTADGRRSTTTEILTIEQRTTSGAGSIYTESISVAETRT